MKQNIANKLVRLVRERTCRKGDSKLVLVRQTKDLILFELVSRRV